MNDETLGIATLHQLLVYDARKCSSAEAQLINILPFWINLAGSITLKNVLQEYQVWVQQHTGRLLEFINDEKIESLSRTNMVMQAFITETREKVNDCTDPEVQDACLLACIQAINHYKISMYGTAAAFAKALGNDKAAMVFHEAELNEKKIDEKLSAFAQDEINIKAVAPILLPGKK